MRNNKKNIEITIDNMMMLNDLMELAGFSCLQLLDSSITLTRFKIAFETFHSAICFDIIDVFLISVFSECLSVGKEIIFAMIIKIKKKINVVCMIFILSFKFNLKLKKINLDDLKNLTVKRIYLIFILYIFYS